MTLAPSTTELVTALEAERCRCLVEQRFDRLRELLSPRLVHTHTRGNADDRESYLAFMSGVIQTLSSRREDLRVIPLGEQAAVMHGKQVSRSRHRRTGAEVEVASTVTQVWACEDDGQWRLIAFQATPLGAPPPAVPR